MTVHIGLDFYSSYEEVNAALGLPRDAGPYNDCIPLPALDQDVHPEQYSCVVVVRKWSYEGLKEPPDLSFIGLQCCHHLSNGYKTDIFIYERIDGNDSHN